MEYRFDFITSIFINFILSPFNLLAQYLIFTQTKGCPGWSIEQLILFQGIMLFWIGLKDTIFGDLKQYAMDVVRKGDFDRLLLKPYPPVGILLVSGFNYKNIGTLIAGLIIAIFAYKSLGLVLEINQVCLIILCIFFGLLLSIAFDIIYCSLIIIIVQINRVGDFIDNLLNFSRYPAEIFSKILRVIFLTILPFTIWIYFPTQILLDRFDFKLGVAFIFCLIFFLLSLLLWNWALKKYSSAGG
jgi:ABC-2 type transport system permease protein